MNTIGFVVKLSSSDILASQRFYTEILGFVVDERYTINVGGCYLNESYVQLDLPGLDGNIAVGLYKDIYAPPPKQEPSVISGTVPTFLVADIKSEREALIKKGVSVGEIISNTSGEGYTDEFAFFQDPDNNSLVIRQNIEHYN